MSAELVNTTIVSDVKVTKEDLIAIAMSRHEQDLMAKEIELSNRKKNAGKELKTAIGDTNSKAKEKVLTEVASTLEPVVVALKQAGFSNVEIKTELDKVSETEIAYQISIREKGRSTQYGYNGSVNVSKSGTIESNKEIIALLNKREALNAELISIQEKRIEIKKALRNLGTVERSAKAAIAKSVLEQSAEGRAMLDQIDSLTGLPSSRLLTGK